MPFIKTLSIQMIYALEKMKRENKQKPFRNSHIHACIMVMNIEKKSIKGAYFEKKKM